MKKIILKLLHAIRYILGRIIIHLIPRNLPSLREQENITCYKLYEKDEIEKCYHYFKKYFNTAMHLEGDNLLVYGIKHAIEINASKNNLFLEFGVWNGRTINLFSKYINKNRIYGFDTFSGTPEDWKGTDKPKGYYSANNKIPKLNENCIPIKGLVKDTLPSFLSNNSGKRIRFVHMDLTIYEPTLFVLNSIKPYLANDAIIIFRGFYNYPSWQEGEFKALTESFDEKDYKYIAFSKDGSPVIIKYIRPNS